MRVEKILELKRAIDSRRLHLPSLSPSQMTSVTTASYALGNWYFFLLIVFGLFVSFGGVAAFLFRKSEDWNISFSIYIAISLCQSYMSPLPLTSLHSLFPRHFRISAEQK
jgi:hypothetical protein